MTVLGGYAVFIGYLRIALFWAAVAAAIVCVVDWAIRTRRISPFSGTARFFRNNIDPLMVPVERRIVRAGGHPSQAPFWTLLAVVLGGLLLLYLLQFIGGLFAEIGYGVSSPTAMLHVLISWTFGILRLALIVRVLSSWFPVSPYSRWIRWSYVLTEWMLAPLRSIIPMLGPIDITPIIAFFALGIVQSLLL